MDLNLLRVFMGSEMWQKSVSFLLAFVIGITFLRNWIFMTATISIHRCCYKNVTAPCFHLRSPWRMHWGQTEKHEMKINWIFQWIDFSLSPATRRLHLGWWMGSTWRSQVAFVSVVLCSLFYVERTSVGTRTFSISRSFSAAQWGSSWRALGGLMMALHWRDSVGD